MKVFLNTYPNYKSKKFNKDTTLLVNCENNNQVEINTCGYSVTTIKIVKDDITTYNVKITATEANSNFVGFEIREEFEGAKMTDYVFAPASLYNGNRYKKIKKNYPPMLTIEDNINANMETVISDIPSLSLLGDSDVYINSGDTTTPCFGFYDKENKRGTLIFTAQRNSLGNYGFLIQEKEIKTNRAKRSYSICSPCVRPKKYDMCTTEALSYDKPVKLKKGEEISISLAVHCFDAKDIDAFYSYFYENRRSFINNSKYPNGVPFKKAYDTIEKKYNASNWQNKQNFYRSSVADGNICGEWQTGWVGGTMNTLPMLMIGDKLSKERSYQTIDFVFDKVQAKSGLLYGIYYDGNPYGDSFSSQKEKNIAMSRKNADALYFLIRHILYLDNKGHKVPQKWIDGTKKFADTVVEISNKYGHFGQFLDIETKEIIIGSTASAGIVMGGLALCSKYYKSKEYLACAEKLATFYNDNFVKMGLTNGGPGEILQCPDSESAFGLLESYVTLFEITGEEKYKGIAENIARQCSSWCVSYDYDYNKETQFATRGVCTTGSVWANTQNKHSAPGICTLSGSSLLRLYRMTGKESYLTLLKDISHNITQYLSIEENPIRQSYIWHNNSASMQKKVSTKRANKLLNATPKTAWGKKIHKLRYKAAFNDFGRINERVNLSDWEGGNNVGEVCLGSCWCEVSTMLIASEVPSIYIDVIKDKFFVFDHLEVTRTTSENGYIFNLKNPTRYSTDFTVYLDNDAKRLTDIVLEKFYTFAIKSGEFINIELTRQGAIKVL